MEQWQQNALLVVIGLFFIYLVYKTTTEKKENFGEITKWKKELREENEINDKQYKKMALSQEQRRLAFNKMQWENQSQWENKRMMDDIQIVQSVQRQRIRI